MIRLRGWLFRINPCTGYWCWYEPTNSRIARVMGCGRLIACDSQLSKIIYTHGVRHPYKWAPFYLIANGYRRDAFCEHNKLKIGVFKIQQMLTWVVNNA